MVLSELPASPGPTHSVFDVLAAAALHAPRGRVGILGFAAGGLMAPLRALGATGPVEAIDLDPTGHALFARHCGDWAGRLRWKKAEAAAWLRGQPAHFDVLIEDLSVPQDGDVFKPEISWTVMPALVRDKLRPGGLAVFNLMRPPGGSLTREIARLARLFPSACQVRFAEYENRILIAGDALPAPRELGRRLRAALTDIGSRQARRIEVGRA